MEGFADFCVEGNEILDEAEDGILALEENASFTENYNLIFRCLHSLKGAAGMFDFQVLEKHMHHLESLFVNFKDRSDLVNSNVVDYFLKGIDEARKIFDNNQSSDFEVLSFEDLTRTDTEELKSKEPLLEKGIVERKEEVDKKKNIKSKGLIFAVDDEEDLLFILRHILEDEGFVVETFSNPLNLLEVLECKVPDLIVADYKMPQMNGLDLIKNVFKKREDVEVVFLSAHMDKDRILEGLDMGVYTFLDKPVHDGKLINVCRNAIEKTKTVRLLNKSMGHLMYHFCEYSEFLQDQGKQKEADELRKDVNDMFRHRININKSKRKQ